MNFSVTVPSIPPCMLRVSSLRLSSERARSSKRFQNKRQQRVRVLSARRNDARSEREEDPEASFYEILEVDPAVEDMSQVKTSYRRLQKAYHPDVYKDGGKKSQELNTAYATLIDSKKRADYDRGLRSTTGIRPGGVRSAEGLVGPMLDGTMISVEDFECVESSNPDAMCSIASQDMEEAVTYVRQWAHTLAYGAEVPLPMPLQCDNVPDGVRVAVIRTSANRIASMGELTFTVVEALDPVDQLLNKDAPPGLSVQVNRRVAASDAGLALPGEERIMKAFSKSMKKLRGEEQRNPFKLTGILASIASGAIGMIPWGSNESEAYDGYYLRPQGARVPAGGSYIVQEHWNVEKSRAMDYMRFGGQYEKMRRLLGSTTGTDYELVASDLIEKGDNTTDPEALDIIMKELNVLVEGVSEQLDNKYAGSA